jgi:hypothetical protein
MADDGNKPSDRVPLALPNRRPKRIPATIPIPPSAEGEPLDPVAAKILASGELRRPRRKSRRPGPGNPGKRATVNEVQERIIGTSKLIIKRLHKHHIVLFLTEKFGVSPKMAEIYIRRAREYLVERSKRPREDFVSEAIGFYEDILRDPDANRRDRMGAQLALRQMLGLDMPFKIAPPTTNGASCIPADVIADATVAELAALHSLHLRTQQRRTCIDGTLLMTASALSNPT